MSGRIEIESDRSPELLELVRAGMRRHAESCVGWEEYQELTVVRRTEDGRIMGAALGEAGRGWLHVSVLWVDEPFRRQDLGSELLTAMETEGRKRGCHSAYLDTFSYQARPFYEKLGYKVFGTLDDYPPGHQRFFMRKRLIAGT